MRRRTFVKAAAIGLGGAALHAPAIRMARAAERNPETLLVVTELGPNSLDIHGLGANRATYGISWNVYDRLIGFGTKTLPSGVASYDYFQLRPELAERWQVASDGLSCSFWLRPGTRFHDGKPVTAHDVKWSFDRAIAVGAFPQKQLEQGSLTDPQQFVVIDERTFRVDFARRDKLTLPTIASAVPAIYNAELAKSHATPQDPWATDWLKLNGAASGAFQVESFRPGEQIALVRNEAWTQGPLPGFKRVILRVVPSAANRRALLERGDVDISLELPPKDFGDLAADGRFAVASVPMFNTVKHLALLTTTPPFDRTEVRQAVAWAIPYQKIIDVALFGRAQALHGAPPAAPSGKDWPQPFPYTTDLERARALLAKAGITGPLDTALAVDANLATVDEPTALLIQESLAPLGIRAKIEKLPDFAARRTRKDQPLAIDIFGAWFDDPDFWFRWVYHGQNTAWNMAAYRNPEMDRLLDAARYERDGARYLELSKDYIRLAMTDMPFIPLYQPVLDVALRRSIAGYVYMFHRQVDFRPLRQA